MILIVLTVLAVSACTGTPAKQSDSSAATPPVATVNGGQRESLATPSIQVSTGQATTTPAQADELIAYRSLVDTTLIELTELTRLLRALSLDVGRSPDGAARERQLIQATTDTFRLVRDRLDATAPPARYEKLHMQLQVAVASYIQAAEALDVDPATRKVDLRRFQEFMVQGGKNVHAAAAELSGF